MFETLITAVLPVKFKIIFPCFQGVESSRGAVILFADADGATKFADLSKLESGLVDLLKGKPKSN